MLNPWWRGIVTNPMRRLLLAVTILAAAAAYGSEVNVSAASSLQDAMREVAGQYEKKTGEKVILNVAGSNVLARQIAAGAPADVFLSADEAHADFVKGLTRTQLLTTSLVVVSRAPLRQLSDLKNVERIAIGNPSAVPAGVYARKALTKAGLWEALVARLIPMENVRAALAAVDNGSVDAAIVYRTDAMLAKHASHSLDVPREYTPPIMFPAVLMTAKGRRFFDFVRSAEAAAVFKRFGFVTLEPTRQ
jgi:molybdate transport system substrate-binding protein